MFHVNKGVHIRQHTAIYDWLISANKMIYNTVTLFIPEGKFNNKNLTDISVRFYIDHKLVLNL